MAGAPPSRSPHDRARYYAEAQAWAEDTLSSVARSHATAWRIALLAILIAALNGAARLTLLPIRSDSAFLFLPRMAPDVT